MSAVALALTAAVTYGLSDFVGGLSSLRAPAWAVALMSQVGGLAVLLAVPYVGGAPTSTDLAWALLAGLGNGIGTAFLYRGLSTGRMGVVAPLSGVGAALLPVLAGVVLGERPGPVVAAGLVVAAPAIWFVSREPTPAVGTDVEPRRGLLRSGLGDGLLAGAGFGTLFVALAQLSDTAGLLPIALNQAVGAIVVLGVASMLREAWVPRRPAAYVGLLCGVLGMTATLLFLYAAREGLLTVSAVLTSLYPAVTVLLAAVLLRERIHRSQGLGLGLCAVAVTLVALG